MNTYIFIVPRPTAEYHLKQLNPVLRELVEDCVDVFLGEDSTVQRGWERWNEYRNEVV